MSRWKDDDESDDWKPGDDEDDEDEWSPDDPDDDGTIPCPYCGRDCFEDAPRCPYCGNYLSREDVPASRKPWWLIIGAVAGLLVTFTWILGFCRW